MKKPKEARSPKKLKVVHINFSDLGGGAEEFARSISARQNNVLLVKTKQTSDSHVKEISKGKLNWFVKILDKLTWKLGFKRSFRAVLGIQDQFHFSYSQIRKERAYRNADIVHLHNIHGEFFDFTAVRKIRKEKPIVWTSHDMWLMTGGEGFIFDGMTREDRMNSYPLRRPLIDTRKYNLNTKKKLLNNNLDKMVLVSPSTYHEKRLRNAYPLIPIQMIHYGIDLTVFYPRDERNDSIAQVLIFSSKSIYKRSEEVVRSLSNVRKMFHLHVIGTPIPKIAKHQTNHDFIIGRKELAELFRRMDVGIFSSNEETFGLLPAEVAACGTKVLLNSALNVFHEHKELYNAELFEDENDLTHKVSESIDHLESTRQWGDRSAELIKINLSRKKTFERYSSLYQQLL